MLVVYYFVWIMVRIVTGLFFRIRISGLTHLPAKGGFIVATNHISYYDPPLVGSWSPRRLYYLAKKELFRNRFIGMILTGVYALPVKRTGIDRKALELCVTKIRDGAGLVLFPEGTRSLTDRFLDPRPGIGIIAIRAGCPIVPGYIHGTNRLGACLIGKERLSLTFGEPLSASWVSSIPPDKEGYRKVAETVMERIGELRDKGIALKPGTPMTD
ncbi:MAG: lysophospholipid acyltransferase family protein [candidate division Zixibacteria bacterium]|nr:lysophospholipid acyltransferase family protein [candidate division Zixibacteria bacterium]